MCAKVINKYPAIPHKKKAPTLRAKTQIRRPGRPPRVEPSETNMETPENIKTGRPPKVIENQVPMVTKKM